MGVVGDYSARLRRAGKEAVPALAKSLGMSRSAAAETFGATAGLVIAALARHQHRRPGEPEAANAVVEKYGRPADVDSSDIAIGAHLARPRLDPRLGGLLGDAADRATRWIADRTGAAPDAVAKAMAAGAPIALGALHATVESKGLGSLLDAADEQALESPARLAEGHDACADAFRIVRRSGRSRWLGWLH
jgi:hypothetical protein